MNHPLLVRPGLDFLLYDWLKLDDLLMQQGHHSRETIDAIMDIAEKLAVEAFLPHFKEADQNEPTLAPDGVHILPAIGDALRQYAELGFFAAGFPEDLGGLALPFTVSASCYAWFAAANASTAAYPMLTAANARLIAAFGSPAQIETFALPQIEGRWFGTMCLSEPQAGSDLAAVRTRAVADGEDDLGQRYRITGNKMWISGGDQDVSENIVHLVLAKIPDADGSLPSGTKGLSLFIVPRDLSDGKSNDVSVAGLNHKMGYRGTANCLLNFGENDGASGWLVGQAGDGLRQMFMMMNEARISVGIGAAAMGYRGYRHSLAYARERIQGRSRTSGDSIPIIEHADVRRMLLAQKAYGEGALALCLYCAHLVDQEQAGDEDAAALLALLTPVAKTFPSEFGLTANDLAIQVHGGYGYTRDFDVEQLYRDNRLNPIHEGTTGVQGQDLLGRKILYDGKGYTLLQGRILATQQRAAGLAELASFGTGLQSVWYELDEAIANIRTRPSDSQLDNATLFLRAFGHGVTAWLWLDLATTELEQKQAGKAVAHDGFADSLAACRYFFDYEVPLVSAWLKTVNSA
ncbi:MAG: acyl-CoA dehydrogenase [Sphingomonadaceae bacterium]